MCHLPIRAQAVAAPEAPPKPTTGEATIPQVCVVLGTQWGDEGKGKLVDILARQYDIVARAQVETGSNILFVNVPLVYC